MSDDANVDPINSAFEKMIMGAVARGMDSQSVELLSQAAFQKGAELLLEELKQTAQNMLESERADRAEFEAHLYERWKPALDLYKMIHVMAYETGEQFNQQNSAQVMELREFTRFVLIRLHARACYVAGEVLALLKSGYATGAMARWRTIHEIAVVMCLIKNSGQDLAERYYYHQDIETAKAAEEFQKHCRGLGQEPLSDEEMANHRRRKAELVQQFGNSYKEQYGWAADLLKVPKPTFAHLEEAADLEHVRPDYRLASHGVHSNPKAIAFDLGDMGSRDVILAGPTNAGLADPGQRALQSLLQCTIFLLNSAIDVNGVIVLRAMSDLVREALQAFFDCHQQLVSDEEAVQAAYRADNNADNNT